MDAEELQDIENDIAANQGGAVCFDTNIVATLVAERSLLVSELKRLAQQLEEFAWTYREGSYLHKKYAAEALLARGVLGSVYTDHRLFHRPYGMMCRDPVACRGKGYCPRDPTCGD